MLRRFAFDRQKGDGSPERSDGRPKVTLRRHPQPTIPTRGLLFRVAGQRPAGVSRVLAIAPATCAPLRPTDGRALVRLGTDRTDETAGMAGHGFVWEPRGPSPVEGIRDLRLGLTEAAGRSLGAASRRRDAFGRRLAAGPCRPRCASCSTTEADSGCGVATERATANCSWPRMRAAALGARRALAQGS